MYKDTDGSDAAIFYRRWKTAERQLDEARADLVTLRTARDKTTLTDAMMEIPALMRECCKGYKVPMPHFPTHDLAKRLFRMGWRRVAPPILSTCANCGAKDVVTSQSLCIECVGQEVRRS